MLRDCTSLAMPRCDLPWVSVRESPDPQLPSQTSYAALMQKHKDMITKRLAVG